MFSEYQRIFLAMNASGSDSVRPLYCPAVIPSVFNDWRRSGGYCCHMMIS